MKDQYDYYHDFAVEVISVFEARNALAINDFGEILQDTDVEETVKEMAKEMVSKIIKGAIKRSHEQRSRKVLKNRYSARLQQPKKAPKTRYSARPQQPKILDFLDLPQSVINRRRGMDMKSFDKELKEKVQRYINCFRNEIAPYLQKDVAQKFNVVSFPSGVIVQILQGSDLSNRDYFRKEVSTINEAFATLGRAPENYWVGKDLENHKRAFDQNERYAQRTEVRFGGGIMLISGKEDHFWTEDHAAEVVEAIVQFMANKKRELNYSPK